MIKIFLLIFLIPKNTLSKIQNNYTQKLEREEKIQIPLDQCREMEEKMGSIMYINVDGFDSKYTIDPIYDRLVKRIQPAGVLPKYQSSDPEKIKKANHVLQNQSILPLLIGVDHVALRGDQYIKRVGLGMGDGLLSELDNQSVLCHEKMALISGGLQKAVGINNPLGPTIEFGKEKVNKKTGITQTLGREDSYKNPRVDIVMDRLRELGLETTIKHFPYTPSGFNLHDTSLDVKVAEDIVDKEYLPIFKRYKNHSGLLMTTHLYNSNVDRNNFATFSKKWLHKLRNEVGFKGLVMTDPLFMIDQYKDSIAKMVKNWPASLKDKFNDESMIFAVKAINAGHDIFFVESSAPRTEALWKNLVEFSCQDNDLSNEFRERVKVASARVKKYKKANISLKNNSFSIPSKVLKQLVDMAKRPTSTCKNVSLETLKQMLSLSEKTELSAGEDIFPCARFITFADTLKAIHKKIKDVEDTFTPKIAFNFLIDSYGERYDQFLEFLDRNPQKRTELIKYVTQLLISKNSANAAWTLTQLDGWKDNLYINSLLKNGNEKLIKRYIELARSNNTPKPDIPLALKYIDSHRCSCFFP